MEVLITQSQFRTDTLENWNAYNPILKISEPAIAINGKDLIFKIGDGVSKWKALPERGIGGESISDPVNDGKLYGRVKDRDDASGHWQEIIIPEIDKRKNFNDLLQAEYNTPIDMGFTINVNDVEKKVFGYKTKITGINVSAAMPVSKIALTDVYSIIDVRGNFYCGHNDTFAINSYNSECFTSTRFNAPSNTLFFEITLNDKEKELFNAYAELFIMYTKVNQ